MKRCTAYRSLLDAGVNAAAGSDFSPGPFAPLMGIQGLVTRKGSITPGKLADFVVLSEERLRRPGATRTRRATHPRRRRRRGR